MADVILARGAFGELVRQVQNALLARGFDPEGVDQDFGGKTQRAVVAFQEDRGLPATGEVDADTWTALTGAAPPGTRDLSLQVTATFEGHGFGLAQGNWDGAGITWGVIGFTLKHGELQKIVRTVDERAHDRVVEAFGNRTDELLEKMAATRAVQMAWADEISVGSSKVRLAEPWRSGFARFGELEEVQAAQLEIAERDYAEPARATCDALGLTTRLGFALAFDCQVQNGGVKARARQRIDRDLDEHPVASEGDLRVVVAHAVADSALPKFRDDVRERKLTLATGAGRVHGRLFVLRNWGLGEQPL
jgi:hypothetical protein